MSDLIALTTQEPSTTGRSQAQQNFSICPSKINLINVVRDYIANCDRDDFDWLDTMDISPSEDEHRVIEDATSSIRERSLRQVKRALSVRYNLREWSKPVDYTGAAQ